MTTLLKSKYSGREIHRLGFAHRCVQEAVVLNRVVKLGCDELRRKFVQLESDASHVPLILKTSGPIGKSPATGISGVKVTDAELERRLSEPALNKTGASAYRSCVMRAAFLAQYRADIGEATNTLARSMSLPTAGAWRDLKHLARYLLGRLNVVLRFNQQTMPKTLRTLVDSDHGAERHTRRSTTGMVQRLGMHTIKTPSDLQTPIGLNVSEAEFYALLHGSRHALGNQSISQRLRYQCRHYH